MPLQRISKNTVLKDSETTTKKTTSKNSWNAVLNNSENTALKNKWKYCFKEEIKL